MESFIPEIPFAPASHWFWWQSLCFVWLKKPSHFEAISSLLKKNTSQLNRRRLNLSLTSPMGLWNRQLSGAPSRNQPIFTPNFRFRRSSKGRMSIDHLVQNDSQGPQRGNRWIDGSMDGFASFSGAVKRLGNFFWYPMSFAPTKGMSRKWMDQCQWLIRING